MSKALGVVAVISAWLALYQLVLWIGGKLTEKTNREITQETDNQ